VFLKKEVFTFTQGSVEWGPVCVSNVPVIRHAKSGENLGAIA